MPIPIGIRLLASVAACLAASAAFAQAYKASDIVSHFTQPQPQLGASRALCIGTASECAKDLPAAAPKPNANAFNLRVNFEYNSDQLTRPARQNLDEFAKALKDPQLGPAAFVVEGHTDGAGGEDFNLGLSVRRANSVVGYLESRGVPASKLEAKGFGKQRPIDQDPLAGVNRRVETRLRD